MEMVDAAIVRMLADLDPHSVYIPKKDKEKMNEPLQGKFEGVGIQFNIFYGHHSSCFSYCRRSK